MPDVFQRKQPIVCYVTDSRVFRRPWLVGSRIRLALGAGVEWIQIREKQLSADLLLAITRYAIGVTQRSFVQRASDGRARIIVNDRFDVSLAAGAAGVHLGLKSIPIAEAVQWCKQSHSVRRVAAEFMIGASCHSLDEAVAAEHDGATYIFFGPVFDTPSKRPFGAPQGLERLSEICRAIKIPVIAIGGVNERNAASCIQAGARGIAAIRLFQESLNGDALREFVVNLHAL